MNDKLKQLRKLAAEGTTPGPWVVGEDISQVIAPCPCCGLVATCARHGAVEDPLCYNSEYIAAANPQAVLELFDEIDRLEEFVKRVYQLCDQHIIDRQAEVSRGKSKYGACGDCVVWDLRAGAKIIQGENS